MTRVWDGFPAGGPELLALLALADWCDDEGNCWPSVARVSERLRVSRSQAQRILHSLVDKGFVAVTANANGGAPGTTRRYRIELGRMTGRMDETPRGRTGATGSKNATGRMDVRNGPRLCTETGRMDATQTVIEPSIPVNKKRRTSADALSCPPDVDGQVWIDWIALREAKRAPVTQTVLEQARREAEKANMSLADFLRIWCARGSQGLQADWIKPNERGQNVESFRERDERLARERVAAFAPGVAAKPRHQSNATVIEVQQVFRGIDA